MDVTASAFSATQVILAWTLLGLLLSWLIIFAMLSLRVFVKKNIEIEELSTPFPPLPDISARLADTQPQYIRIATGEILSKSTNSDTFRDSGSIPVK